MANRLPATLLEGISQCSKLAVEIGRCQKLSVKNGLSPIGMGSFTIS
jgi:hypothetical protein